MLSMGVREKLVAPTSTEYETSFPLYCQCVLAHEVDDLESTSENGESCRDGERRWDWKCPNDPVYIRRSE